MGLDLIFSKPHLTTEGVTIAQHRTYRHERGLWFRISRIFSSLTSLWQRTFVRRELFIRNANGTKRVILEKSVQVQLALVGIGLVFWLAYATSGVLLGKSSNKIMQERLAETHNAYETKISNLQKEYEELNLRIFLTEKEFTKISDELTKRHDHLTNLIGVQERLGKKMQKRHEIQKGIDGKDKKDKESWLKPLRDHDDVLLSSRPAGPTYEHFPSRAIKLNRSFDKNRMRTNNKNIDRLTAAITTIDREQRAILDHIEEDIKQRLMSYQKAFAQTEAIKADLFVAQVAASGDSALAQYQSKSGAVSAGGPLVAIAAPQKSAPTKKQPQKLPYTILTTGNHPYKVSQQARAQINSLQAEVDKLTSLDKAIAFLPLAQPLPIYHITSAFGPRIDPFTREWAFHTGIDIAGKNDIVQATLPGIIVFAGQARGFGKMVEINHGFGITTRYAHLKKISVRKGQKVNFKQQVGLMGNTGRSTGEHLHYEILFNDKPYDPWKFMEAGKNVFEASQPK